MKNKVIIFKLLKENKGKWVSGQTIADLLDLSRNAISKHMRRFRTEGLKFDASTFKGYKFIDSLDKFYDCDLYELTQTQRFGYAFEQKKRIKSTNDEIFKQLSQRVTEGFLLTSEIIVNSYENNSIPSTKGKTMHFSLLLEPETSLDKISPIKDIACRNMLDTMVNLGFEDEDFSIKDDFIMFREFVCGKVYFEFLGNEEHIKFVTIGFDVLMNYRNLELDNLVMDKYVSLNELNNGFIDKNEFLIKFLKRFEIDYYDYKKGLHQ